MSVLLATAAVSSLAAVHWLLPQLWLRLQRRRLAAVCRQRRCIAITFDDGPGRMLTPLVSARLQQAGVPATFFLLSANVRGNEDIVDDLVHAGHEIGSHGDAHVHHMWSWPWVGVSDTRLGWQRLQAVTGRPAHCIPFRPPYGKLNALSLGYVLARHTPVVGWTHDGYDTRTGVDKSPAELADELRRSGGGVVLLHDFDRAAENAGQQVLAKLDAVLALRAEGYRFVGASSLVMPAPLPVPEPIPEPIPVVAEAQRTRPRSATFQAQVKPANSIASSGTGK